MPSTGNESVRVSVYFEIRMLQFPFQLAKQTPGLSHVTIMINKPIFKNHLFCSSLRIWYRRGSAACLFLMLQRLLLLPWPDCGCPGAGVQGGEVWKCGALIFLGSSSTSSSCRNVTRYDTGGIYTGQMGWMPVPPMLLSGLGFCCILRCVSE